MHFHVLQKARMMSLHLQEGVGRKLEKLLRLRQLEKVQDFDEDCFTFPVVITVKIYPIQHLIPENLFTAVQK